MWVFEAYLAPFLGCFQFLLDFLQWPVLFLLRRQGEVSLHLWGRIAQNDLEGLAWGPLVQLLYFNISKQRIREKNARDIFKKHYKHEDQVKDSQDWMKFISLPPEAIVSEDLRGVVHLRGKGEGDSKISSGSLLGGQHASCPPVATWKRDIDTLDK